MILVAAGKVRWPQAPLDIRGLLKIRTGRVRASQAMQALVDERAEGRCNRNRHFSMPVRWSRSVFARPPAARWRVSSCLVGLAFAIDSGKHLSRPFKAWRRFSVPRRDPGLRSAHRVGRPSAWASLFRPVGAQGKQRVMRSNDVRGLAPVRRRLTCPSALRSPDFRLLP